MNASQFRLLGTGRFLPFFIAQMLGAFNDNLYKQALVLAILFRLNTGLDASLLVNLCALLFILPFFLFSALGGQLGERFAKDRLMRALKLAECFIMLLGALGFISGHLGLMLAALFLMGTHSALFGPVKYSILPQHLNASELLGGNALVETGTFLAILGGSLLAGWLMLSDQYAVIVSLSVLTVAVMGYLASRHIPLAPPSEPKQPLCWNVWQSTLMTVRLGLSQSQTISRALWANSWFWFVGATYLTQIPAYVKSVLKGDEVEVSLILTLFSVGIGVGSLLCERLAGQEGPLAARRLVPLGALGLTLGGSLLWWHSERILTDGAPLWAYLDILGLGLAGGLYIVPLYALVQAKTAPPQRSRVIAAGNILNALFMVASAMVAMVLLGWAGASIPQLFLCVALLNLVVNLWLFFRPLLAEEIEPPVLET